MNDYVNYILLDNFRGFEKTVVPLSETNFFVGENSAGKSSILSLIKIITEFYFWIRPEFRSDDVNLGHSEDIISISSKDKSYFRVGYLKDANINKQSLPLQDTGYLITFADIKGNPEPKNISIGLNNNSWVHIKVTVNNIYYKIDSNYSINPHSVEEAQEIMCALIDHHQKGVGYTKLKQAVDDKKNIFELVHLVLSELRENDKNIRLKASMFPPGKQPIWLAPIRSKPKRTYDEHTNDFSSEGEHTPYLISNMLGNKSTSKKLLLEKIGQETGLFKKIQVKKYGRSKNAPFELDFVLDEEALSIVNVGYGVSQSIPILAEIIFSPKKSTFIIQQPEVHLHPRAQAAIGNLIFESSTNFGTNFLVETHSDFLIDRYRYKVKTGNVKVKSQVLFFTRKNGSNFVSPILINENGELDPNQPEGYRDFFIKEQMKILGL